MYAHNIHTSSQRLRRRVNLLIILPSILDILMNQRSFVFPIKDGILFHIKEAFCLLHQRYRGIAHAQGLYTHMYLYIICIIDLLAGGLRTLDCFTETRQHSGPSYRGAYIIVIYSLTMQGIDVIFKMSHDHTTKIL